MTLRARVTDQLTSIRAARTTQLEQFFESLDKQVRILANDRNTIEAMAAFNRDFAQLELSLVSTNWEEWNRSLQAYYTDKFFPRLSKNISQGELQYDTYRPQGQAARYLQYYYIAENPNPLGEKEKLLDPGDGSQYTQSHAKYQPLFKQLVEDYGYHDLLLINPKTLDIVYSVFKETDYGTTLKQGPYSQSGLSDVVQAVLANPAQGSIQLWGA